MNSRYILFFVLCIMILVSPSFEDYCTHPIFCSDQILSAVVKYGKFGNNIKLFIDSPLKVPVEQALKIFKEESIQNFVTKCFGDPYSVIQNIDLPDFKKFPQPIKSIKSRQYQTFALDLNLRWNQLAKKVNLNITNSTCTGPLCTSMLPEAHGRTIIIPGGRFRQVYYWDTYWIILGLIQCQLYDTAQNLIKNLFIIIDRYGFIPNALRVYMLNRSQPPVLSFMVRDLAKALRKVNRNNEADHLEEIAYPILNKQHDFWMNQRAYKARINGKQYTVNHYNVNNTTPRPQEYKLDVQYSENMTESQKKQFYIQLATVCQSGWDFSTRWFKDDKTIETSQITNIVPSDLNAILGIGQQYLSQLSLKYGNMEKKKYYDDMIRNRRDYFLAIKKGDAFPDFYKSNPKQNRGLYPCDLFPHIFLKSKIANNPFKTLISPASSSISSGQQWDYPNVWTPPSWVLHEIVSNQQDKYKIAQQWVKTTYCSWKKEYRIYEKYSAEVWGKNGQGGLYEVQVGFGWCNGLTLYYLSLYGKYFDQPDCQSKI